MAQDLGTTDSVKDVDAGQRADSLVSTSPCRRSRCVIPASDAIAPIADKHAVSACPPEPSTLVSEAFSGRYRREPRVISGSHGHDWAPWRWSR